MNIQKAITRFSAQKVLRHHFGHKAEGVKALEGGLANFVFEARVKGESFVVRISDNPAKLAAFQKEQWVAARVRKEKIPAPVILEVSNEAIGFPYMISRKMEGCSALESSDRFKVVQQMGELAARINAIRTRDFGTVFDWTANRLSSSGRWIDFLRRELNGPGRILLLEKNHFLPGSTVKKLRKAFKRLERWKGPGTLTHGDLRLKNVLLNSKGNIGSLLDWEHSLSTIGLAWELSIALHDLTIDEKGVFLEGVGKRGNDWETTIEAAKCINILNYAPVIERALRERRKEEIENFRLRLRGHFDLYSF